MRKRTWLAATGGSLLAAMLGLFGAAASASASTTSPVAGYTYVNGNTATANTIAGYARHADGSLTPIAGSPFTISGAGLGAGLGSQGAIQATRDGRYLLAVDAGSNQVSVLRVTAGGVPVQVGEPVSSGGIEPVSVAVSPSGVLYVANKGNAAGAGGNFSGFRLGLGGTLTPIPGATYAAPAGSGPSDVLFNSTGTSLVGTLVNTSQIESFKVLPGGRLLAAPGSPFTGQGLGQIGAEFRPTSPSQLFVTNAHNGAGLGTVSAFSDNFLGQLSPIGSSPYADGQTAPCWVEISHNGQYLFAINTGSGNISSYSISPNGSLTLIGSTAITGGGADTDARLSPDGNYLLVDGAGMHFVSVFAVNGGTLTELPSSPTPLPASATASAGIANT
ncbi:MAG TPA: beta-propeller fold lactonase family protein [Trebonia sp.]|nr:beta-propeller fold lactonase family protein [Trebonia sp.]